MFREGSQVVDAKNFLLKQPQLHHITLEGQTFYRNAKDQVLFSANKKIHINYNEQIKLYL